MAFWFSRQTVLFWAYRVLIGLAVLFVIAKFPINKIEIIYQGY